ncbi:MAG: signal recognition particle protein [Lentisphaerae bacterium RIFOXYB12_FULL_65_16]|nr:MAG: signal recognition particle protein [Lentisphaerae bacterium RIFOXYA12_64_32]OGV85193.1 MAG: signal recognition particle protein [Lentisphaerae bacterium RIFOXYB12_FULL_65_16]
MFERLTNRFQDVFRNLTGRGRLTEANVSDAMEAVRRALLEADVNYHVAKEFVAKVRQECMGEKVLRSVTPGQQAVKVVNDQLVALLGGANAPLDLDAKAALIMLVGLHGSGKTTTAAKLALHLRDKLGRKVLLAACDVYRPAAIDQLESLGRDLGFPVHAERESTDVAQIAVNARNAALAAGLDIVILDTAGRLQIDETLVQELVDVKKRAQPREILLVADAALGQEAVSVADHFNKALGLTGIILTKLDGDARGGAALSMRQVTGQPIKFVGIGERPVDLEPFHPDRMASRILGMGDVISLVEKASEQYDQDEAEALEEKLRESTFDFNDFMDQMSRIRKMGGFMSLLDMLPGVGQLKDKVNIDEKQFNRIEGIIHSMTPRERENPDSIDVSRRRRIAKGCGLEVNEVNQLIKQFQMMRQMMSRMGKGGGMPPGMAGMGGMPGAGAGGMPGMPGYGKSAPHFTKARPKPRVKPPKQPRKHKKRRR